MKLICLAMLLFLWVSPMSTTSSKTVVRIKRQAMEYACQTQRRPLQRAFGIIPIPELNQKKESSGGILGGIFGAGQALVSNVVNLVGIRILDVKLPDLNVKLVPKVGMQVSVDTHIHISGNLLVLGAIELKLAAGVLADVQVSKTSRGVPIMAVSACKSILGDIDITVGGLGLLRPVIRAIQGHIHAILGERLCVSFSNTFLGFNANFGLVAEKNSISKDLGLQYTLQKPPVVAGDYMDMDMDAEYTVHEQVVEFPTGSQEFTLPPGAGNKDAMVNMGFSQDYFSSLFVAFLSSGGFNLEILSTHIRCRYPQPRPVNVNIVLSQTPVVTIRTNQIIVQISPNVEMSVVLPNSRYEHLFTINVEASLVASLDIKGGKLKTSVSLQGDLKLVFASVSFLKRTCKPSLLSGYMRTVFEKAYLIQINEALSVGVSLPSLPNIHYIHQVVEIEKNYVVMSCDVQYSK
uniref:Uncharacterized protein n=1 Tax=Leptobrachium leishanense TaxID=445787 RepID=A0A8C5R4W0_9ANUR